MAERYTQLPQEQSPYIRIGGSTPFIGTKKGGNMLNPTVLAGIILLCLGYGNRTVTLVVGAVLLVLGLLRVV